MNTRLGRLLTILIQSHVSWVCAKWLETRLVGVGATRAWRSSHPNLGSSVTDHGSSHTYQQKRLHVLRGVGMKPHHILVGLNADMRWSRHEYSKAEISPTCWRQLKGTNTWTNDHLYVIVQTFGTFYNVRGRYAGARDGSQCIILACPRNQIERLNMYEIRTLWRELHTE